MEKLFGKINIANTSKANKHNNVPKRILRFAGKYFLPVAIVCIAGLIKHYVDPYVVTNSYLYFTIVILFFSWLGGMLSGLISLATSMIVIFLYFLGTPWSLDKTTDQLMRFLFFFLQSTIIIVVINGLNKSRLQNVRVKENIDKERQKVQKIIDTLYNFVVVISPDGKVLEANKATVELEITKRNIVGKDITEIYPWSYSVNVQQKLRRSIVESLIGTKVGYDEKMRIDDNRFLDIYLTMTPTYNSLGEAEYIIVTATDITERKSYEVELERMHKNYLKLINSNIIGMIISDKAGNIHEINDAFLKMIKLDRDKVNGTRLNLLEYIEVEHNEVLKKIIESTLSQSYAGPLEIEFFDRDKKTVPALVSTVLINEEEGLMLFVVLDITERKELEQKKDEFLSIASHELKTPLTTLKGYVQLLGSKLEDRQKENEKFVSRMDNQLVKITELINDLLDISRIQAGNLVLTENEFDIVELCEDMIQEIAPLTTRHQLNLFKPKSLQIVKGDRVRLGQVITNLLTNAIKFSPDSETINVYVQDLNGDVKIIVEDFGIGIPRDKIDKLFRKFYRVEENQSNWHQGLGIGLFISNEIVKQHGSLIKVMSEEGRGSQFYFTLSKVKNE